MSAAERRQAFDENHPYRSGVAQGYPLLKNAGEELVRAGVSFIDLTEIFSGHEEVLYNDTCCHTNEAGYAIIADRVLESILPTARAEDAE